MTSGTRNGKAGVTENVLTPVSADPLASADPLSAESVITQPATLRRLAAKGLAWSAFQTLASRILSVATFVVLARLLPPHAFGVVAFASVAIAFLTIFVQQGFSQAIVQTPHLEKRHLDTAFWVSIGFGCLLAAIVVGLSWPIADAFSVPEAAPVLRVLAIGFILSGLTSTPTAILQRRMQFRSLALRSTLGNLVGAVVGIAAAVLGAGVWALVAQSLCATALGIVVVWKASGWRPGFSVTRDSYRQLFRFSRNIVGVNVAGFFLRRSDDFFIGAFLGPALLGVYTVAYRLVVVMMDVTISTVQSVALPTFSRLQHDRVRLRTAYFAASRVSSVVALPAFCFVIAAAPEIIQTFFGPRWEPSIPIMRVLAIIGVANTITNYNATVLTSSGRPDLTLRFMGIASVVNLLGVAIAVHWGVLAVAMSLAVRNVFVGSPLSIHYVHRELGFSYREYFRTYLAPTLASLVLAALVLVMHAGLLHATQSTVRLGLMFLVGGAGYVAALRLLDRRLLAEVSGYVRTAAGRSGAHGSRVARPPGRNLARLDAGP